MAMILTTEVGSNQFEKARRLNAPIVVIDSLIYRLPSSRPGERDHKVQLDDPENPRECSCTCEAGVMNRACWAMARVLDVIAVFRKHNIYVSRGASSSWAGIADAAGALVPRLRVRVDEGGDVEMSWGGHPETKAVYVVP